MVEQKLKDAPTVADMSSGPMPGSTLPCGCHIQRPDFQTVLCAAHELEVAAVPDPREDIDWSKHRGSCRVFYAERRCTCGATTDLEARAG